MPVETQHREIKGHAYSVTPFTPMRALKYASEIVKLVGPSMAQAMSGIGSVKQAMDMDLKDAGIEKIVGGLVDRLDGDATPKLIHNLLASTTRDGQELRQEGVFNEAYTANYGEMIQALRFVLEVNYGSFFDALATGGATGD